LPDNFYTRIIVHLFGFKKKFFFRCRSRERISVLLLGKNNP